MSEKSGLYFARRSLRVFLEGKLDLRFVLPDEVLRRPLKSIVRVVELALGKRHSSHHAPTVKAKFSYKNSFVRLFSLLFVQVLWLRPITSRIKFKCRAESVATDCLTKDFSPPCTPTTTLRRDTFLWPWTVESKILVQSFEKKLSNQEVKEETSW